MTSRSPSGGSGEYAPLHHTLDPSHRRESINGWTPSPRPGALGVPAFDRSPASLDRASRSSVPPGLWTVPLPASISSDRPVSHSASYSQTVQMGARATPPNGRHLQPQARDSPLSKTPSRLAHSGSGSSLPPSDWRWPYVGNGSSQSGWAMRELTPSHVNARLPQAHALSGSPGSQSPQHLDRSEITTPRGCFPPFQPQTFGLSCPSQDNPRTAASSVTSASTLSSRSGPSSRPVLSGSLASPDDKVLGSQVLTDGDGQGYHARPSSRRALSMFVPESTHASISPQHPDDFHSRGQPSSSFWADNASASVDPARHSRHLIYTPSSLSRQSSSASLAPQMSNVSLIDTVEDAPMLAERDHRHMLDLHRLSRAVSLAVDATHAIGDSSEQRHHAALRAQSRNDNWDLRDPWYFPWKNDMASPVPYVDEPESDRTIPIHAGCVLPPSSLAVSPLNSVTAECGASSTRSTTSNESANTSSRISQLLRLPQNCAAGAASFLRQVTRRQPNQEKSSDFRPSDEPNVAISTPSAAGEARQREQEHKDSDLSLALYVSSVNFMLSALKPESAERVSERHRTEMRITLMEALHKLESTAPRTSSHQASKRVEEEETAVKSEIMGLRRELQAALSSLVPSSSSDPRTVHHVHTHTLAPGTAPIFAEVHGGQGQSMPQADLPVQVGWRRRMVSAIAWGATNMGLAASARAVEATARAVGWALPADHERYIQVVSPSTSESVASATSAPVTQEHKAADNATFASQLMTGAFRMVAGAAAAANERHSNHEVGSRASQLRSWLTEQIPGEAPRGRVEEELVQTAAQLGRAIRRSQLPTQLALLGNHLLVLMSVLNSKYALRQRTADFVVNTLSTALRLVRSHEWHVRAARALIAGLEAAIAAVRSYREVGEEHHSSTAPRLCAPPDYARAVA